MVLWERLGVSQLEARWLLQRVQPEGAASLVGRQEGKGAASAAGEVWVYTDTLSVWAACGW